MSTLQEIEQAVKQLPPGDYTAFRRWLDRFANEKAEKTSSPTRLSPEETALFKRINQGWPETNWNRYRDLIAKRRAETLTDAEQQELIALGDKLEAWNVRRLRNLIKLAELRQTAVDVLMKQLGIKPWDV